MNYNRPELLDRIGAAYALGLLRHGARARFEQLCTTLPAALASRHRWEDRLLPLALQLLPVAPNAGCWPRIQRSIAGATAKPGLRWWPAALAASLIAAALLVGKLTIWSEPAWHDVAVLAQANAAPLWRLERSADYAQINIRTVAEITLSRARSYELWVLPAGGGHPVSLGLLPREGRLERKLTPAQRTLLLAAVQVAVSVEPAGGSPTGLPTGPVIIVASIRRST
ncbi:MAG TPA: anti-sigma factor [Steroidobacteraceae bacterium]